MNERDRFEYTYSSSNRPKPLTGREQEIIADASDTGTGMKPVYAAILLGVVSCLVFGLGMCFALGALPKSIVLGVLFGIIGTVGMLFAYPVHRRCIRKAKETHQARILELAAQLCGETNE